MDPEWSLWVHDMKTGEPLRRIWTVGEDPWSTGLGEDGSSTVSVVMNDAEQEWQPGEATALFAPNSRMIVRWWGVNGGAHPDDFPVFAHKIDSSEYNRDAGTFDVQAIDVLDFADWRLIDGVGADKNSTLTIAGKSGSGAVRDALIRMMQWDPNWYLPVDPSPDGSGAFSGSWVYWKGILIADVLKEIKDRTGVEIYLEPYATSTGGVRLRAVVGAPINLGTTHLHLNAEESPLSGVRYRISGSNQITGLEGIGQGTGFDQQFRHASGVVNIPIRDTRKTFPDLVGDALQQAADTYYANNVTPTVQWDIGAFVIGEDWSPQMVAPGRVLALEIYGDPVIADGVHYVRVVKLSGGNGRQLKPEVQ